MSPTSYSIVKKCKKNLYNKYILFNNNIYIYICKKTLVGVIYLLQNKQYMYVNYNNFLIFKYYLH